MKDVENFLRNIKTDPEHPRIEMWTSDVLRLLRLVYRYKRTLESISKDVCVQVNGEKTKFKTWTADLAIRELNYDGRESPIPPDSGESE